ncbi:hypothetical protein N8T08_007479 [Aspergillus melleus]|uniref:Uncharacterized protein n=1 Tax=Aspergillus melleus TaxID=138277 RepID=A0ACC3AY25_9EURO|nr:hypothetical protein N8T08_007479 [Aspergillus melleus]
MSFGYSLTGCIALVQLSCNVYKGGKEAPQGFENVSYEVLSLHPVSKEAEETVFSEPLEDSATENLQVIGESCRDVLNDLQNLIREYQSLGTNIDYDPYSTKEFLMSTTCYSPKVKYFNLTPSNANKA